MLAAMRLVIRSAADVTERERHACYEFWDRTFPRPAGQIRQPDFAEPTTVGVLLLDEDDALVGGCRLLERAVVVDGAPVRVAALASVAVTAAHRGRGHGSRIVQIATDAARANGRGWAVLFCSPPTQDFYRRLGWRSLEGQLLVGPPAAAQPVDPAEDAVMALPLTRAAADQWPAWRTARIVLPNYW